MDQPISAVAHHCKACSATVSARRGNACNYLLREMLRSKEISEYDRIEPKRQGGRSGLAEGHALGLSITRWFFTKPSVLHGYGRGYCKRSPRRPPGESHCRTATDRHAQTPTSCISIATVISAGWRPSRVAFTISGNSSVRPRIRPTYDALICSADRHDMHS